MKEERHAPRCRECKKIGPHNEFMHLSKKVHICLVCWNELSTKGQNKWKKIAWGKNPDTPKIPERVAKGLKRERAILEAKR